MVAPRLILRSASALAAFWLLGVALGAAQSILAGTVTDAITQQPIGGAAVVIRYGGQTIGTGTTDINGQYIAPFAMPAGAPALTALTAVASKDDVYEAYGPSFQVDGGRPVGNVHNIALFPKGVTDCRSQSRHSVIVGYFAAPAERDVRELSRRIAESLRYELNTSLQKVKVTLELLPSFEPCDAAKPRTPQLGASFAKALKADAFLSGNIAVADSPSSYTVNMYVSDAYGFFRDPMRASNRSINLDNPSGTSVSAETHAAMVVSIAAGLKSNNDCVTAISVLSVAEQLVRDAGATVQPGFSKLRADCEALVPQAGLRRRTP
jgi:hypothetical protein